MAQYGHDLTQQLLTNPKYLRVSDKTVPPEYNVANENPRPMFVSVDFGLVRNHKGGLDPKLVELQAFPTLYGYQPLSAQLYIDHYGLPKDLGIYLGGFDHDSYRKLMRDLIVAGHDPENVILLEIDPQHQKTLPDFLVTQKELGIAIVDVLSLKKHGNKLYYTNDGREIEVQRIYNRCIVDELESKGIELPFDIREPLDVEWAGHPNWYFRISKFSIPYLNHPCVPDTWFLDEHPSIPDDNENYILKPLVFIRRSGHQVRAHRSRHRRHSRRRAPQLHRAGAHALRARHRHAPRHDPDGNPHHVRLARRRRTHTRAAAHPHGPRHDDGRRP